MDSSDEEFEEKLATKIYCHNIDEMIQNENNGNETEIKSGGQEIIAVQSNEKLSEYEKIRERNIQKRKEMLNKMKIASANAKKCKKSNQTGGTWNCSLCTYKNFAKDYKCTMVPIIYFFDGRSPSRHKQNLFI